ncbi:MAG: hypothetical protein WCI76_00160 [bacterium]
MKKKLGVLFMVFGLLISVAAPMAAFAVTTPAGTGTGNGSCSITTTDITGGALNGGTDWDLRAVICRIEGILSSLVPLLMIFGFLYFIWGVISYVIAGDEEAKTAGRDRIIYGVIGFTAIVTLWGLVAILANTFNINKAVTVTLPVITSH